jgi:multicomponent Na+:H+ antiporter subunit D
MIGSFPPGSMMTLGAFILLIFPPHLRSRGVLLLSSLSLMFFWGLPSPSLQYEVFGLTLTPVRVDSLSWTFTLVFHIAAIISGIYSLHMRDIRQQIAAMVYAGAAIGAVCAGDLLTLFVYWELTAISSVFLVWASHTQRSYRAGMRYLIIQVGSGVLLFSGAIVRYLETGSLRFELMTATDQPLSLGAWLILAAFGIKAAFPLLHNWLQDSYPEATITGTVFLSTFTTKLAIYSLVRGFAGLEWLIWVGCAMTLFPIVFAVIENDLRRVLAYSLNNQLGFMVVGIGIGTELSLNGTVAHAFCHIIYKALLFMSMGAVLYRTGTIKATELGGLHKSMPWTTVFCLVGAASISAFPLLSGFISKGMIIAAAAEEHNFAVWFMLLIASAGVMEHSGIKIPYFAFFAHDSGKRVQEAPLNMLIAMGIAAALCLGLGIAYPLLYRILPFGVTFHPYTVPHVVTQLQLLLFATLAFVFLMKTGLYPAEMRATNLDTDWFYRKAAPAVVYVFATAIQNVDQAGRKAALGLVRSLREGLRAGFNERGMFGSTWSTNTMAFWATLMLIVALLLNYINLSR